LKLPRRAAFNTSFRSECALSMTSAFPSRTCRELRILDEFYRPSRMSKLGRQIPKAHPSVLLSRRCHNSNDPNAAFLQRLQCAHPGRFFTYQDDVHASHKVTDAASIVPIRTSTKVR
jgi:hypothetical protein